jgi:hypothetical protein
VKNSSFWIALSILSLAVLPAGAQAPAPPAPAAPAPAAAAPTPVPPTALLRSSLGSVQSTLVNLHTSRWKHGSVRDEATEDIQAVQHEIGANLPPLLRESDAAPESISKALPVVKHVGAVYDVLLRIYDAARIAAPGDQVGELQSALRNLERARLNLNDRLQTIALTQEQQISALRVTVQKQAAFKCPAPPPVKPCPKPRVHHYTHRRTTKPEEKKKPDTTAKPKTNP